LVRRIADEKGEKMTGTTQFFSKAEAEKIRENAYRHLWLFGASLQKMKNTGGPLIFSKGEGCYLYDLEGNKYIDGHSGVWVVNAGHGREEIISAMTAQARQLDYALSEEGYANVTAIELAEKLVQLTQGEMDRVYFTCGGSESVEIALRMARVYHRLNGKPKKVKIIARRGSYHGATLFTLTVSAFDIFSKAIGPNPPGVERIAHPYCYRCEFGKTYPQCQCECARDLERKILAQGAETVAAFIGEPISTLSGAAIPPREYWERIRGICDKYNVILIADEIVTWFGRTGRFWGMEHFGLWPDIMAVAKGLTSGYAPLGAIITNKNFTRKIPDNAFLMPGYTFTGHPPSCAAGLANLRLLETENLIRNAENMGKYLYRELKKAIGTHRFTGEIRGIGMMVCIELVKNKQGKETFDISTGVCDILTDFFRKNGLYLRLVENYIHIAPPLVIQEDEIDAIVRVVARALAMLEEKFKI
jgi:adenosylmethionine-8-amino-7-oxononanoate aminotransferase